MGKVKELVTEEVEILDEAYENMEAAKHKPLALEYVEAKAFYNGCITMYKTLWPYFNVELVNGHHELS